jgi:hypothetical protein
MGNRTIARVLAVTILVAFASPTRTLASPEFLAYEGRNAVHEGQGGERKTVEGIDFWFDGDPPKRFQVLGSISDRRMKTGLYGMIRMSSLEKDIAKAAKAAGGDAVILQSAGDDLLGMGGFSNAYANGGRGWASGFGSSFSAPIEAHVSRYVVVKYLPDDAPAPTSPAPETGPRTMPTDPQAPASPSSSGSAAGTLDPMTSPTR